MPARKRGRPQTSCDPIGEYRRFQSLYLICKAFKCGFFLGAALAGGMSESVRGTILMNSMTVNPENKVNKKRILHVAEAPGGVERFLVTLLTKMKKYDDEFEHILVCSDAYNDDKFANLVASIEHVESMQHKILPVFVPSED